MKLLYDCHAHTNYSHGKDTAAEMIATAHEKGLSGIYITEHGPYHLHSRKHFNDREKYLRLREEIENEKKKYPGMDIRFGAEANVISLDGETDVSDGYGDVFDFVNVGYHMMVFMKGIKSEFSLQGRVLLYEKLGMRGLETKFSRTLTDTMLKVLDNYDINMITHPTRYYPMDMDRIASACVKRGTLLEINSAKGILSAEQVRHIAGAFPQVLFAAGSDAHSKDDVGNVKKAFEIIESSGLDISRAVNVLE